MTWAAVRDTALCAGYVLKRGRVSKSHWLVRIYAQDNDTVPLFTQTTARKVRTAEVGLGLLKYVQNKGPRR